MTVPSLTYFAALPSYRYRALHRFLAEFDFRYNHRIRLGYNDGDRAALAVKNADGKCLTYRQPHEI